MDIAPNILRLHPELDAQQREVIGHGSGPMLVIAGPGSGKTLCVELRAVNLLLTGQVASGELMLCTFGRDAAHELQQRFRATALACGIAKDAARVRITTIHSLCHRLLVPRAGEVGLRPGYQVLNEEEQRLLLHQESGTVFGPDWEILEGRGWRYGVHAAAEAARYFDRICDELIDPSELAGSEPPFIAALGRCFLRYRSLLLHHNATDFAHLQMWAHGVMQDHRAANAARGAIRHLMVDEFQDTSRIQTEILERLVGSHGNIVVVGDDDQALYRFRGASVANLLEFPRRFPGCRVLELSTNYRSHKGIVSSIGRWMDTAARWDTGEQSFRYAKDIVPDMPDTHAEYPAVISVQGQDAADEARQLSELIRFLKTRGVIRRYGQVALLLHSVMDRVSGPYLDALESAGIPARCEPAGHGPSVAKDEVLVTTIHQAKGMEWDVVIVGSLTEPDIETDRVGRIFAEFLERCSGEPADRIADFDRARLHYVAFTRAKDLLVLTCAGEPNHRFRSIWDGAAHWPHVDRKALARQRFRSAAGQQRRLSMDIEHLDRLHIRLV